MWYEILGSFMSVAFGGCCVVDKPIHSNCCAALAESAAVLQIVKVIKTLIFAKRMTQMACRDKVLTLATLNILSYGMA